MSHPVRVLCALLLGGTLLLASRPALACSCAFPPLAAAREGAAAVFEGRVLAVSTIKHADAGAERAVREITLSVVRSWKGLDKNEQVVVRTSAESSLCGYGFTKGKSYLVFANDEPGGLAVNACSRTRPVAQAGEDLTALGAGATPVTIASKGAAATDAGTGLRPDASVAASSSVAATVLALTDAGTARTEVVDAGVDAGIAAPQPPPSKGGGCASGRGQASLAPYFLGLPAWLGFRRRRARPRTLTRS
ncbi:MAG: hypothetical protein ABW252_10480 [Polyangiales bacterium]